MNKTWRELTNIRSLMLKTLSPIEKQIEDDYQKSLELLKAEKEDKIKKEREKIESKINPKNYDLDVSGYILNNALGFEIGKKVLVKKRKNDLSLYKEHLKDCVNDETYIFEFRLYSEWEGIFHFQLVKNKYISINAPTFDNLFEVIKVLEVKKETHTEVPVKNLTR